MEQQPTGVCLATLGGQPQVVTLALDILLSQGIALNEVFVVHLSPQNKRYREALATLEREFANEQYRGQRCRYRPVPIRSGNQIITELDSDMATRAVMNTLQQTIKQLKQQDKIIHLCLSGGRRLLGMLALSTALLHFDHEDRIWHLYSSDSVREQTSNGKVLHLPKHPETQLIEVPVLPWGHMFAALHQSAEADARDLIDQQKQQIHDIEHTRCQQVYDQLSERPREVLQAIASGMQPQDIANQLCVSLATIRAHQTPIFQECRNAWGLDTEKRLTYHWLREKFRTFF
jgi:CRISPR-associated protein Csx14